MLAIVSETTVEAADVDGAAATVRQHLLPRFLGQVGAVEGHWLADRSTGRLLTVTIWTDRHRPAVGSADAAVVLGRWPADVDGGDARPWARVTCVEGIDAAARPALEAAHLGVAADESRSEGFRGSLWLAQEHTGRGLALSLWDGPHALIRGEHESKRRRHELADRFGARIAKVSELECLGVAVRPCGPEP